MELDDKVCLCFRISKRKLLNFTRREQPKVASQLSQCGGAGTGCGWCVPYLRKLFEEVSGRIELERIDPEEYRRQREDYRRRKGDAVGPPEPPSGSAGD